MLPAPVVGDLFASYISGVLLVEVPMSQSQNAEAIADYIQKSGIDKTVRVYDSKAGVNSNIPDLPIDILTLMEPIEIVRAKSLDELIVRASMMIEKVDKRSRVEGRIPTSGEYEAHRDDYNNSVLYSGILRKLKKGIES